METKLNRTLLLGWIMELCAFEEDNELLDLIYKLLLPVPKS